MSRFYCRASANDELLQKGPRAAAVIRCGGDKSVTHRALFLAAMARGVSVITNPSPADDCKSTISALEKLGVSFEFSCGREKLRVKSPGCEDFAKYRGVIDCGNSGTTARFLMGLLSGLPGRLHILTGDESLSGRPMARVAAPLRKMGAEILLYEGDRLPAAVEGSALAGAVCENDRLSAQVKTAVLLAGITASKKTSVVEKFPTRDHFERIAPRFGVDVESRMTRRGNVVSVRGGNRPSPARVEIPGDVSSAAFYLALDALRMHIFGGGTGVVCKRVLLNRTRSGFLECLEECGFKLSFARRTVLGGEEAADISIAKAPSAKAGISPLSIGRRERVVSMIDEVPVLAVLLAHARGRSVIGNLSELRFKETNRLSHIVKGLAGMGAGIALDGDSLVIEGVPRLGGGSAESRGDHRLAMAFSVAGLLGDGDFALADGGCASVSNPGFFDALAAMGFRFGLE